MDLSGWVPPEIAIVYTVIVCSAAPWVVYGLYVLSCHLSIGWH